MLSFNVVLAKFSLPSPLPSFFLLSFLPSEYGFCGSTGPFCLGGCNREPLSLQFFPRRRTSKLTKQLPLIFPPSLLSFPPFLPCHRHSSLLQHSPVMRSCSSLPPRHLHLLRPLSRPNKRYPLRRKRDCLGLGGRQRNAAFDRIGGGFDSHSREWFVYLSFFGIGPRKT